MCCLLFGSLYRATFTGNQIAFNIYTVLISNNQYSQTFVIKLFKHRD